MTNVFVEMILPSCVEGSPSWSTRNRKNLSMFTPPDMQVVQVVVGSCSISFADLSLCLSLSVSRAFHLPLTTHGILRAGFVILRDREEQTIEHISE